jgi:predicted Zn-dependent peptidase
MSNRAINEISCRRLGEKYQRIVHQSGLSVLVFPKEMQTMSAMVVVRYGAQDLRFGVDQKTPHTTPAGVAHYLEHQLFTREDEGTVDEQFSSLGAEINAWTDYEKTAYTVSTSDHALTVLERLLTFVTHPTFTERSVQKEQGIIAQEIRMVADDPWDTLHRRAMSALYPHHPTTQGICGSEKSISKITPGVLYDCYHAFYTPENMYFVVCGDVTTEEVMAVVDRVLPQKAAAPAVRRCNNGEYDKRMPVLRKKEGIAGVSKPIFEILWRDDLCPDEPTAHLAHAVAMDVLSEILFSRAGVFYNSLLDDGLITMTYSYGYTTMQGIAYHCVGGESDDPEAVLQRYFEIIDKIRKEGISYADFERNRRVAYAGFVSEFDDTEEIADVMVDSENEGVGVFDRLTMIEELTHAQLQSLFDKTFDARHTNLTVLYPEDQEQEKE